MELSLLEKPPVAQLLKNFPTFYGTRRFFTMFTRALDQSLSWARSIQFTPPHPISLRSILLYIDGSGISWNWTDHGVLPEQCGFLNGWMMVKNDGVIYNFSAFCDAHYRLLNPETSSGFKDGCVVQCCACLGQVLERLIPGVPLCVLAVKIWYHILVQFSWVSRILVQIMRLFKSETRFLIHEHLLCRPIRSL
jgi:hypothetical protein